MEDRSGEGMYFFSGLMKSLCHEVQVQTELRTDDVSILTHISFSVTAQHTNPEQPAF